MRVTYAARYGLIDVDELEGSVKAVSRKAEYRDLPLTRYAMPSDSDIFQIPAVDALAPSQAVLKALLERGNAPTGSDGRLVVQLLVAAYTSAEHGGESISLDDPRIQIDRIFPWA